MEFEVKGIDFDVSLYQVQKAIAAVLHGPDLFDPDDPKTRGRVPNFLLTLNSVNDSTADGVHNGTGILILPTRQLGDRFADWLHEKGTGHSIKLGKQKLRFFRSRNRVVGAGTRYILEKALYIEPDQEENRQKILRELEARIRIEKIQFGIWYKPPNAAVRAFSVEYQRDYSAQSSGYLNIVYDYKEIKVELGERMTEEQMQSIIIKFSSIRKMGVGYDFGTPFIVFDLLTPPIMHERSFNDRLREGIEHRKKYKLTDRISALDDTHARVAPYAHHLRILLNDPDDIFVFERMCKTAECEPRPIRIGNIDIAWRGFYEHKALYSIKQWVVSMFWNNAFQIEAMLRNGLLNTQDLLKDLYTPIEKVLLKYGTQAGDVLRLFTAALRMREPNVSPAECLARVCEDYDTVVPIAMAPGHFACHHVTFTPTRMILEGPYVTQSNRVIRKYQRHRPDLIENFIRVEFRDEDRLSYRWDRDVDGTWFLQQRVGSILKNGFELGGKQFEFLAYSNSALREHAVWFMARFRDPFEGYVTAEIIRRSLGDFSELLTKPSKYAARIAQAFTATDSSVVVHNDQWEEQEDLGPHTDGVGTISQELADLMWKVKCDASPSLKDNRVKPSAYQMRFLGYKGVVVVDPRLEGIKMRLRPSQRKFTVPDATDAEIEIARSFDYPNAVHFNRPVIMALEDRGVRKEAFIDLQEEAKKDVYMASSSLKDFRLHLKKSGLGFKYHLAFIFEQLEKIGLDLQNRQDRTALRSPFIGGLVRYSINHVLRDMKHKARIPVPKSHQLVGVADEGQAYIKDGCDPKDVFTLDEGRIFVCIQESPDDEPKWLKGSCVISRSPVIHPGDIQRVHAVGKPPDDKLCAFRDLRNVVVLPAVGDRSLASCLAGGDLDGDTFDIYYGNPSLLPTVQQKPAEYSPGGVRELPDGKEATVADICDFIVEYINSDVVSLLADKHLTIADQSQVLDGTFDSRCMTLAQLCSQAVDYPKNGIPVDIDNKQIPRALVKFKPDWHKAEVTGARDNDYYESDRALGYLYRNIELQDINAPLDIPIAPAGSVHPLSDPISVALAPIVQRTLSPLANGTVANPDWTDDALAKLPSTLYARYAREQRYIRTTHTLTDAPDIQLEEEEVVLGTILANCTQGRWRRDRIERMKLHADTLVKDIRTRMIANVAEADEGVLREGLKIAWDTWVWSMKNSGKEMINSFGLVALGVVLDCLKRLKVPELSDDLVQELSE